MAPRADGFEEPDEWLDLSDAVAAPLPHAPLTSESRIACLRLCRTDGIGPATFRSLINQFGGANAAIEALPDLARSMGRKRVFKVPSVEVVERELEWAERISLVPIFTIEPGYPPLLAHIPPAPPPLIYVRGNPAVLARPIVAIVGSRSCSAAGQRMARQFATELGAAGYVIASGLARGIDRAAHEASLARGTVAVLAGGLDTIYPPEHAELAERITANGCLLTEHPPGFSPRAQDFPRRNRLISGISRGVVIVEAAARSGTLTTARFAAEQGRDVFAVPGHPLDPRAEGVNQLIKQGVKLTTCTEDITSELGTFDRPLTTAISRGSDRTPPNEPTARREATERAAHDRRERGSVQQGTSDAEAVWRSLGPHPTTVDDIVRTTGLSVQSVTVALLDLQLTNRIIRHGQGLVSRREGRQE